MNKTINNGRVSGGCFLVTDRRRQDYVWERALLRFGFFHASSEGECAVFFGAVGTMRSCCSMFLYSPITNIFFAPILLLSVFFKSLRYDRCSAKCNTISHLSAQSFVL